MGRLAAQITALGAIALLAAGAAHARSFQMSGSWALRRGNVFFPLQFATMATHTSHGDLTSAGGFPNGPVPGLGSVTATGSAPATLRIPPHRFGGAFATLLPGPGAPTGQLVQITTRISADGPAAGGSLAPGGGPGSFTWCPGDPACFVVGGMLSTDPPQGSGPRNGRIVYRAGPSRFGGTMQMLLRGGGSTSVVGVTSPFRVRHRAFSFGPGSPLQHTGGPYSFMQVQTNPAPVTTQPFVRPAPFQPITSPGDVVPCSTALGSFARPPRPGRGVVLATHGGPHSTLCPRPISILTHTGFPFTTGSVFAQQSTGTGGDDFFTLMGADQRTPLGAGNLSLVAGGLTQRRFVQGGLEDAHSFASFGKVQMTLAPPIPTLSPAGLAAGGVLLLLVAGWAFARRRP